MEVKDLQAIKNLKEKKDIRIIGLDLDGTLLDPDKKITKNTYDTLEEAARRGIEIIPTTGRYYGAMPPVIRELPFVHYCANINGASVADLRTGRKIYSAEIPLEEALEIMRYLDDKPVIYDCYMDDQGWITGSFKEQIKIHIKDPHYQQYMLDMRQSVPELKSFITQQGHDIQKIQFFSKDHDFQQQMLHHGAGLFPDIITTCSVADQNVEINQTRANKGDALNAVAKYLGLGSENVMSFGDGSNDIPMLEAAGVGVAMANACPEAKAAADYITLSNTQDGVAEFIKAYCF